MLREVTPCALVPILFWQQEDFNSIFSISNIFCQIMDQDIEEIENGQQLLTNEQKDHIDNFMSCTGMYIVLRFFCLIINRILNDAGESMIVAQQALEACSWNLEMALNIHMDSQETDAIPVVQPQAPVDTPNNLNKASSSRFVKTVLVNQLTLCIQGLAMMKCEHRSHRFVKCWFMIMIWLTSARADDRLGTIPLLFLII